MVEPKKSIYEEKEIEEFVDEDFIDKELALEEENARTHAPYQKSHKQIRNPEKDNTEARQYYKQALKVINSWSRRHKHGIWTVRENLKLFDTLCREAHVIGIDEGWLGTTFKTPEDYATYRRKLSRMKERGSKIVSLRVLR